jgi:hypothetical protein
MKSTSTVPTFYKGDLVRSANGGPVQAWRRASGEETRAWYNQLAEDCRAGRDVPYDSGGESKLAPSDTYFSVPADAVMTIVRGRVSAPHGYYTSKDCCQVFCPSNGETLFVKRAALTSRW